MSVRALSFLPGALGSTERSARPLRGDLTRRTGVTRRSDAVLFGAIVVLMLVGLLSVFTSSAAISLDRFGTPHHYVLRHAAHLVVGGLALVAAWKVDYRALDRSGVVHVLWLVTVLLLVATLFSEPIGGARRWVRMGALSFQPSELAKVAVVLVSAFQLSRRHDRLGDPWRGVLPPLLLVGQLGILVAIQPDFGTAAAIVLFFALMAFVAGTPLRVMLAYGATSALLLGLALIQEPYRLERLRAFIDPELDPLGANFQLRQSLIAIGTGGLLGRSHDGILGTGLGCSLQKLFYLPEAHTDFVFSVLSEELGFIGGLAILALYVVVLVRGLRIAARAPDAFGTLIATGATALISFQALVNVAVVAGLVPTKGIPLPFLSAGGSSLLASSLAAGLLLGVSRHVE